MGLINDGINIATFVGIPKKVIVMCVFCIILFGLTIYATYEFTCAYKEHKANLDDLHTICELQKQLNSEFADLKQSGALGFEASENAINNLSKTIDRTSADNIDMFDDLMTNRQLFEIKRKHIIETQQDYLPHLNNFHISVTSK